MVTVAALYVERGGVYWDCEGIDAWDEQRDARKYDGPHPVVAHPPCARWCRLAGFVEARWGYKIGDDHGTFAAALDAVRKFGGVLEHPAYSKAWAAHDLNKPPTGGGWVAADLVGGWTCYVEQGRYGHPAKKATWLYAVGVELADLRWGMVTDQDVASQVSWCGNKTKKHKRRARLGAKTAKATPPDFQVELLKMARSARP